MTVDELMAKLRKDKKEGRITGNETVVVSNHNLLDDDSPMLSVTNTLTRTVRLGDPNYGPKGTRFGKIVDGRGKPKGTERALWLV